MLSDLQSNIPAWHALCNREVTKDNMNNQTSPSSSAVCSNPLVAATVGLRESTYSMLVRAEKSDRGLFETLAYGIMILSAVFSLWIFAHQAVPVPSRFAETPAVCSPAAC